MFYITQADPNYQVKSARDPLGFQTIWQRLGRNIIEYLSTASSNLLDFRIMAYAYHLRHELSIPNEEFLDFFMRWEQACAYARECFLNGGYNGKNFVSKVVREKPKKTYTLSNSAKHTILSNQKAYGIYGKYNRPFKEIGIHEKENFKTIIADSLNKEIIKLATKISGRTEYRINYSELKVLADLLSTVPNHEQKFYIKSILKGNGSHLQAELYKFISKHQTLLDSEFHLYNYINALNQSTGLTSKLKEKLIEIEKTEKVLHIYTRIFKHIQTKSSWTLSELSKENTIINTPKLAAYNYKDEEIKRMTQLINNKDKTDLIKDIINLNNKTALARNNAPWIILSSANKIDVYYREGGRNIEEWNMKEYYQNNYFLATYISLYRQLKES